MSKQIRHLTNHTKDVDLYTTNSKKRIYLANSYGFSKQQRDGPLQEIVQILTNMGVEVWEPFERNNQPDTSTAIIDSAYKIGQACIHDVQNTDAIFAIINGTPPDEGVMIEIGMAMALNKAIFLFRDDFRRCTDSDAYPLNLMLFSGLPKDKWSEWYYTDVQQITDPNKALSKWLNNNLND